MAQRAEEAMSFQEVQLREGRGPVINQAQFIRAVADNMKQRLFTTVSNRAQASVVATRQEMHENLVSQMAVLNPRNWVHENPRFGENGSEKFKIFHLNNQEIHLGFIVNNSSGGRSISNKFNKLLVAIDTLSPSNADCERGFSAMNNIIKDRRSLIITNNAANLFFISTVGPPSQAWDPDPYVKTWLQKREKNSSLNKWHASSKAERG